MEIQARISRKHYACTVCGQLILPREPYMYRKWAPWEMEDRDAGFVSCRACQWCDAIYSRMVREEVEREGPGFPWNPWDDGWDCCEAEMRKWLGRVMVEGEVDSTEVLVKEGMRELRAEYKKGKEFLERIREKGPSKKLICILGCEADGSRDELRLE